MAPAIRALSFSGQFAPAQVLSDGGKVWLVGSSPPGATSCAVESVDPTTLATRIYPLMGCGLDVVAGGGSLWLTAVTYLRGTTDEQVHVERFDTTTGQSAVAPGVVMTLSGSSLAHTALAYDNGSLWLYGPGAGGNSELVRISASTGATIRTITGVPAIGGTHPALAVDEGSFWLSGGAGGSPLLERIAAGSSVLSPVYTAPSGGSILWVATVGNRVWANVANRLMAFDASGHQVLVTPPEQVGESPLTGSGSHLWSVGVGARCAGPQALWAVNGSTGTSALTTTLKSPIEPCLTEGNGSQLAAVGPFVFVLDATGSLSPAGVLYRVTP